MTSTTSPRTSKPRRHGWALLAASLLAAGALAGCNGSNAQVSSDYQQLPPGEGQRRLQDTLRRRAAGQHMDHPYAADVRVPGK